MRQKWTNAEVLLLTEEWIKLPKNQVMKLFPNRSWKSLCRKGESIGLHRFRLPYSQNWMFPWSSPLVVPDWFVGEMLSDGHITVGGQYAHVNKHENYIEFLRPEFDKLGVPFVTYRCDSYDKRTNKTYVRYFLKTVSGFKSFRNIWYPDGVKIVPDNIKITHEVFFHWFLGDGCVHIHYNKSKTRTYYSIILATMGFDGESILRLQRKLLNDIGVETNITSENNLYVRKTKSSIEAVLFLLSNFVFPACYEYKNERLDCWTKQSSR